MTLRSVILPEKMEYDTYLSNITVIPLIILPSVIDEKAAKEQC